MTWTCNVLAFAIVLAASAAGAATYEVGPGKPLANIGDVPWESLSAGDLVLIHARPTPYREKWVISRAGTAAQPITVRGVADAGGNLPVISGENATTRLQLDYTNDARGILKIGTANPDVLPRYIVIENLDIRSAKPGYTFTDDGGTPNVPYAANAAAIYVERGQHLTIRGCTLHDAGNGLFIGVYGGDTQDILVEHNSIHDNGNAGSIYEHNNYTAAVGIVFQFNHFGPLCSGCDGNSLKDRSVGTVVRYNWIEGGNRQLDLVDTEDSPGLSTNPAYRDTYVYGNVLIEPEGAGNSQICHYGGDSGNTAIYRKGTLHFYQNTVVSTRSGNTTLLRLSTNDESADVRNNVVYVTAPGSSLAMLAGAGALELRSNWFKPGFVASHSGLTGSISTPVPNVTGASPGFVDEPGQDFRLQDGSACIDAGTALEAAVLVDHDVAGQYVVHQGDQARASDGALDIGAFEQGAAGGNHSPVARVIATPGEGPAPLAVDFDGSTSSDSDGTVESWEWDFGDGQTATGQAASHTYADPGSYSARLAVTDNEGATGTITVPITARGLGVLRLRGKLRFDVGEKDSVMIRGIIPAVADGFSPAGVVVELDVGGALQTFTLDAKGKGKDAATGSSVRVQVPSGFTGGDVKWNATLRRGTWSDDWADEGLVSETIKDKAATMAVTISLGEQTSIAAVDVLYRASAGKRGSFRED